MKNKLTFFIENIGRSYRTKVGLVLIMVLVVALSTIFSAYLFKLIGYFGENVGIPKYEEGQQTYYIIDFYNNDSKGRNYKESVAEITKQFDISTIYFSSTNTLPDDIYHQLGISSISIISKHSFRDKIREDSRYFGFISEEQLSSGKPYVLFSSRTIDSIQSMDKYYRPNGYNVGDSVTFEGVEYEILAVDCTSNYFTYVDSFDYTAQNISITTTTYASINSVANFMKNNGYIDTLSAEYYGFFVGRILGICAATGIFAINIFILFSFFLKKDKNLYAQYKMLGASNGVIFFAMLFASLPIVLLGAFAGLGLDAVLSLFTYVGTQRAVLDIGQGFLVMGVNILATLIAVCIASIKRAIKVPVEM